MSRVLVGVKRVIDYAVKVSRVYKGYFLVVIYEVFQVHHNTVRFLTAA